jgi:hypothetical protein
MPALFPIRRSAVTVLLAAGALAWAGVAGAEQVQVKLAGSAEVPPVKTDASGQGTITINSDKTVSGEVSTKDIDGTMAHIHDAAAGKNGPIIIPLKKDGSGKWAVPSGAKLTDAQYKAFQAGDLYVNVHSAAHPGGEIRAQLKP